MENTTDRRTAHARVGAAAIAAFLAILLIGALRHTAQADPTLPQAAPAATSTPVPVDPYQGRPRFGPEHDHDHDHDGFGPPDNGGTQT